MRKFFAVMELAAAFLYMICSLFFTYYGYEDYLMNRSWIVPAGCLLAVVILQFLVGETILHMYAALRWRAVVYEAGVWMICLLAAGVFVPGSMDDYLGASEYFGLAVFLSVMLWLVIWPFSLFSKYGKKSCLYALIILALEMFAMTAWFDSGEIGGPAFAVLLLLPAASFCAGIFHHLASGWVRRKGKTGRKQILLKRAAMVALAGGILLGFGMFVPEEVPEITPRQDEEGYYLLCTREGFEWFIDRINLENEEHNVSVRLTADIVLNDTSDWENWAEEAPEYQYDDMGYYSGHFDGNGHTLEGYYSRWESPIFIMLGKEALVTDLKIRKSLFQSTYGESSYVNDDGEVNVFSAAALCLSNEGRIEGCDVEAIVLGDWSAGGIVCNNDGVMENCRFAGKVEAGRWFCGDGEDESWAACRICAGGICRNNWGSIQNCLNEGGVSCETVSDTPYMRYVVGGIAGQIWEEGRVEDCENAGDIQGPEFSGGIAGSNEGEIYRCANAGKVSVERQTNSGVWGMDSLVTAGICASNGGLVDSCWNTGEVSTCQDVLSYYGSAYGIACNLVNYEQGRTKNCYYLPEKAKQDYRQSGVYKLSETEMAEVQKYVAAGQSAAKKTAEEYDSYAISDVDSWELFSDFPDFPGTDEDDYIHLHVGPKEDTTYEVQPGSDYYLLCANDEEGFPRFFRRDVSGKEESAIYFMTKPADWYYGTMNFVADRGLEALWPQDAAAGDIRILYSIDGNPEGDFLAGEWESAKEKIAESAGIYCGQGLEDLRFYRYELDGGESLYGYSFRLYPDRCPFESEQQKRMDEALNCAVFYRLREGLMAEFIGIEPAAEDMDVLARTRYLAARVADGPAVEKMYDGENFYGRENWPYTELHNPFAVALEYSPENRCLDCLIQRLHGP